MIFRPSQNDILMIKIFNKKRLLYLDCHYIFLISLYIFAFFGVSSVTFDPYDINLMCINIVSSLSKTVEENEKGKRQNSNFELFKTYSYSAWLWFLILYRNAIIFCVLHFKCIFSLSNKFEISTGYQFQWIRKYNRY